MNVKVTISSVSVQSCFKIILKVIKLTDTKLINIQTAGACLLPWKQKEQEKENIQNWYSAAFLLFA